jgi:hypothetical protein
LKSGEDHSRAKIQGVVQRVGKTPNKELKGDARVEWLFGGEKKGRALAETIEEVLVTQPD